MSLLTNIMARLPKYFLYTEFFWKHATPQDVVKALAFGINANEPKKKPSNFTIYGSYNEFYTAPPFALACRHTLNPKIIEILICQGNADPNGKYITQTLWTLISEGEHMGTNYSTEFLSDALENPNPEILHALLDNGAILKKHESLLFSPNVIEIHPIKYKMLLDHNPVLHYGESVLHFAKKKLDEIEEQIYRLSSLKNPSEWTKKYLDEEKQHIEENIKLLYEYKADTVDLFLSEKYWKETSLNDVENRIDIAINGYMDVRSLYNVVKCMVNSCSDNRIITYVLRYCKEKEIWIELFGSEAEEIDIIEALMKKRN